MAHISCTSHRILNLTCTFLSEKPTDRDWNSDHGPRRGQRSVGSNQAWAYLDIKQQMRFLDGFLLRYGEEEAELVDTAGVRNITKR